MKSFLEGLGLGDWWPLDPDFDDFAKEFLAIGTAWNVSTALLVEHIMKLVAK